MDWLGDHLAVIWLAIAVALGVAELASLDLVLLMLAIGALVAALSALASAGLVLSALIGLAAAVASLAALRPELVKRLHSGPELRLGHLKLIGARAQVTMRITGTQSGQIKLGGDTWTAAPYDEHLILEPGQAVEVLEIRGATAYVHPVASIEP